VATEQEYFDEIRAWMTELEDHYHADGNEVMLYFLDNLLRDLAWMSERLQSLHALLQELRKGAIDER
jgi:hypothetical protein